MAKEGGHSTQEHTYWAEYSTFIVGNEASNYQVQISGYTGDSGDILYELNGLQFTTYDSNNDPYPEYNTAEYFGGGFWHYFYGGVGCLLTAAAGYFQCDVLPHPLLKTVQMWLVCK